MNRPLLVTVLLLIAGGMPWLQAAPATMPPLVATPVPGTSWLVTLHYDESDAKPGQPKDTLPPPRRPATLSFHCGSNVTEIVLTWSDGTKTEGYVFGDRLLERNAETGTISSQQVQDKDPVFPVFTKAYPGVSWISAANYKGPQSVGKQECDYYADSTRSAAPPDLGAPPEKLEAWISRRERVPLRIKLGDVTYDYGPIEEAASEIELPTDVAAFAKEVNKEANALEIMRRAQQHP